MLASMNLTMVIMRDPVTGRGLVLSAPVLVLETAVVANPLAELIVGHGRSLILLVVVLTQRLG
jgi:hypothetical protein